jgi:hypothetical protein
MVPFRYTKRCTVYTASFALMLFVGSAHIVDPNHQLDDVEGLSCYVVIRKLHTGNIGAPSHN